MSKDATGASPGPWTWENTFADQLLLVDSELRPVLQATIEHYGVPPPPPNAALIAAAPDMAAMLRELEYAGHYGWCPVCKNAKQEPHLPDCKLARLLEAIGRP